MDVVFRITFHQINKSVFGEKFDQKWVLAKLQMIMQMF